MKAFLLTAGVVFGLIVVAHVWRVISESSSLARDPWFIVLTVLAAAMSAWAFYLARARARPK